MVRTWCEVLHVQGAPRRVYYGGPPPPGTFLPRGGGYPPPMAGGYDGGGGRMPGRGRGRFEGGGGRGRYGPEGRGERRPPPGTPGVSSGVQVLFAQILWSMAGGTMLRLHNLHTRRSF